MSHVYDMCTTLKPIELDQRGSTYAKFLCVSIVVAVDLPLTVHTNPTAFTATAASFAPISLVLWKPRYNFEIEFSFKMY